MIHTPVLLDEVVEIFSSIKSGVIVDLTLGYAGHTKALLDGNDAIKIVACDRDEEALNYSKEFLKSYSDRVEIHKSRFGEFLDSIDLSEVRAILADIGVSSLQLDKESRGFSIKGDTLDMRMDTLSKVDAKFVLNSYPQSDLERVFREFGELKDARNLAKKIVQFREKKELTKASELVSLVGSGGARKVKNSKSSSGKSGVSRATLAFQAIRIEVNKELDELTNMLKTIEKKARSGELKECVVAIISFHSLEDRIVKNAFKEWAKKCVCPSFFERCECGGDNQMGEILTKKVITPTQLEVEKNSRSSCAKLRAFRIK